MIDLAILAAILYWCVIGLFTAVCRWNFGDNDNWYGWNSRQLVFNRLLWGPVVWGIMAAWLLVAVTVHRLVIRPGVVVYEWIMWRVLS